jgi:hypothetical protein
VLVVVDVPSFVYQQHWDAVLNPVRTPQPRVVEHSAVGVVGEHQRAPVRRAHQNAHQ